MTVANPSGIRLADADADVHDLIAERWSPRGFDPGHVLTHDQVDSLLEAARRAPSAANSQPWHDMPEKYAELERSPRVRKPRAEFVHGETWTAADDVEG